MFGSTKFRELFTIAGRIYALTGWKNTWTDYLIPDADSTLLLKGKTTRKKG